MKAVTEVTIPIADFTQLIDRFELNERQRRGVYGLIANAIGYGGISAVVRQLGAAAETVRKGASEILAKPPTEANADDEAISAKTQEENTVPKGKIRRKGGGRKSFVFRYPELVNAIISLLENHTYGNPMKLLKWTTKSLRKIQADLALQGYKVSHTVIGEILEDLGYSKQANQKMLQVSKPHPDRDAQFVFINNKAATFIQEGAPVISIDCKKKENLGNFKNPGQEYRPIGQARSVFDHDFMSKLGKVAPYGIYLLNDNTGFVNLGTSRDTAEFAGESVGRWLHYIGMPTFADMKKLYIVCDGGGSNGWRPRLWKWVLAEIADLFHIEIHVSHLPPGTSKWNKIEHRMFSYITKSWAGQPLVDVQTVIDLISSTTTTKGLKIDCKLDTNEYETGIKISDEDFEKIDIETVGSLPEWNYVIRGFKSAEV